MKLIDFHAHIFPEKIAARTVDALIDGIRKEQGEIYVQSHQMIFNFPTQDGLLTAMSENNIDMCVCMPISTKPTQTESINRFAEGIRGERLLSFGSLHPMQSDWEAVLENLAERGFRGIKLHHQFQGCDFDSKESLRVLKKAEELGLLVVFHAGSDIGLPAPFRATPEKIRNVLTEMEGSNLIAAHLGGWDMWDDVERYLVGTPILMDTAFIQGFLPVEQAARIIKNHGASKILFGTDAPWESAADTLRFVQKLGLSDEDFALITHKNAERLLGLGENV